MTKRIEPLRNNNLHRSGSISKKRWMRLRLVPEIFKTPRLPHERRPPLVEPRLLRDETKLGKFRRSKCDRRKLLRRIVVLVQRRERVLMMVRMNAARLVVRSRNSRRYQWRDARWLVEVLHVRVVHLGMEVSAQTWKISRLVRIGCIG